MRNGLSARMMALYLLLLVDAILSFVSLASVGIVLALALITCVVYSNAAMPKPAAANVAANNSNEIASGLLLVLFSMHYRM
jgi:hypothetical protein